MLYMKFNTLSLREHKMKLSKRQLKRIIREEKQKLLKEYGRTSYGSTPMESFPEGMGYVEMLEEMHYICDQLEYGSVRLMDPEDYQRMLEFMKDASMDGDEDAEYFLGKIIAQNQGQYVRDALR